VVPELRPRGIGEILDAAVALYRARFGELVRYAAIVVVPVQVLLTVVLLSAQPDHFTVSFNGATTPQFDTSRAELAATFVVLVVGLLTHAFVAALTTRVVADEYVGYDEGASQAARTAARRYLAVLGVAFLVALAQLVGLLFCFVGSYAAQALFAVAIPVERRPVFAAMGRSSELTRTHFWHVLGVVLSAAILTSILNVALAAGLDAWSAHGGSPTSLSIAQGLANGVALLVTAPFVAAVIVALYFDLRIRDEAFDVQMALAR